MRVSLLYNSVDPGAGPDHLDVLAQVDAVSRALLRLGHEPSPLACDLDLERLRLRLERAQPEVVFNLVESLGGFDRLIPVVPALLEALGLPYTGCSAAALERTASKLDTKALLTAAGLPVPPCLARWPGEVPAPGTITGTVIVKSVWSHGSPGLEDDSVFRDGALLAAALPALARRLGGECFVEPYLPGRELNLGLLASARGVEVLPPAEISFVDFPERKPRIVGYRAKWQPDSFEWRNTPRSFEFPEADERLLGRLRGLALEAWRCLGLTGHARVDFRLDETGEPFLLEANPNPCLSPDAGFAAALGRAGIAYEDAIARLLDDAGARAGALGFAAV